MWYEATYQQVALFSLRSSLSTSSGGNTLLVPTPFALKMALLDAAIRTRGKEQARLLFPAIRDLQIAIRLPAQLVIINSFLKIVRPKKSGPSDDTGSGLVTLFGSTIANREFVFYNEPFGLAFSAKVGNELPQEMLELLVQINYIGKRGSFIQLLELPQKREELDAQWTILTKVQQTFLIDGMMQLLDDCSADLSFEQADVTSGARLTLGKDRVQHAVVLPCHLMQSSKGFTLFQRMTTSVIQEGEPV